MNPAGYDVLVVVVGGNAAMCAALSACEHGARVLVLEKAPEASNVPLNTTVAVTAKPETDLTNPTAATSRD